MGDPHGGVSRVYALAALAGGAIHIDADLAVGNVDFNLLRDLRDDIDRAKRGVPALVGIERADAYEPVDAALGLRITVGVLALDQDGGLADARLISRLHVLQLDRPIATLRPAV